MGSKFLKYGSNQFASKECQEEVLPLPNNIIFTNRKAEPDAILQMVEDLCGGEFNNIEDVMIWGVATVFFPLLFSYIFNDIQKTNRKNKELNYIFRAK